MVKDHFLGNKSGCKYVCIFIYWRLKIYCLEFTVITNLLCSRCQFVTTEDDDATWRESRSLALISQVSVILTSNINVFIILVSRVWKFRWKCRSETVNELILFSSCEGRMYVAVTLFLVTNMQCIELIQKALTCH